MQAVISAGAVRLESAMPHSRKTLSLISAWKIVSSLFKVSRPWKLTNSLCIPLSVRLMLFDLGPFGERLDQTPREGFWLDASVELR